MSGRFSMRRSCGKGLGGSVSSFTSYLGGRKEDLGIDGD
jgi:hypothetical protein